MYGAWDQCVRNRGDLTPLLVLRKNRGETLAVIPWDHFLALQQPNHEPASPLAELEAALTQARSAMERIRGGVSGQV